MKQDPINVWMASDGLIIGGVRYYVRGEHGRFAIFSFGRKCFVWFLFHVANPAGVNLQSSYAFTNQHEEAHWEAEGEAFRKERGHVILSQTHARDLALTWFSSRTWFTQK